MTADDMQRWLAEARPVADEQSCAFCGSPEWSWVYPLTREPCGPLTCGWFWCACDECHSAVEAGDDAAIIARHGPDDRDQPYSFAEDQLPTFHASRIGSALPRQVAQARG